MLLSWGGYWRRKQSLRWVVGGEALRKTLKGRTEGSGQGGTKTPLETKRIRNQVMRRRWADLPDLVTK